MYNVGDMVIFCRDPSQPDPPDHPVCRYDGSTVKILEINLDPLEYKICFPSGDFTYASRAELITFCDFDAVYNGDI